MEARVAELEKEEAEGEEALEKLINPPAADSPQAEPAIPSG